MNIAGVVVYTNRDVNPGILDELNDLPGVEVHAVNEEGKVVATIEDKHANGLADAVMLMQNVTGVISASMVYHHNDEHLSKEVQ